ncbi:hypothetical protein [Neisseria sp. Ec49-e6-T10]|uniref:hypothetical protein n=1 Tax=Neisseria sp. Ec49-e6-T10 TaxID=3140744 RepID=UPI003EBA891B
MKKTIILLFSLLLSANGYAQSFIDPGQTQLLIKEFQKLSNSGEIHNVDKLKSFLSKYRFECDKRMGIGDYSLLKNEQECSVYQQNGEDYSATPIMLLGLIDQKIVIYSTDQEQLIRVSKWNCSDSQVRLPICTSNTANKKLKQRWYQRWDQALKAAG